MKSNPLDFLLPAKQLRKYSIKPEIKTAKVVLVGSKRTFIEKEKFEDFLTYGDKIACQCEECSIYKNKPEWYSSSESENSNRDAPLEDWAES